MPILETAEYVLLLHLFSVTTFISLLDVIFVEIEKLARSLKK